MKKPPEPLGLFELLSVKPEESFSLSPPSVARKNTKRVGAKGYASLLVALVREIEALDVEGKISAINECKSALHVISPFANEPVDCVVWVKSDRVMANDYNPNAVAPPEMKLLETSIMADGYTQPVVTAPEEDGKIHVVDGFHRNRICKESPLVKERVLGYLPIVRIRSTQTDRGDRIASTIRHNRARGKHRVDAMSDIVIELKRRNWSDKKIADNLGMDPDEILRLCQITGLREVFADADFSKSWELDVDWNVKGEGELLDDSDIEVAAKENGRVYHTWEKWECHKAGFYEDRPPQGMTLDQAEEKYRAFLCDLPRFEAALDAVVSTWTHSCEHYLTNDRMNRIAWLGQASVAQAYGISACARGGYHRLHQTQQREADIMALKYLNKWLVAHGRAELAPEDAQSKTQPNLY